MQNNPGVDSVSAYLSQRKADKSFALRNEVTMTIEIGESTPHQAKTIEFK
jgi:hypothetical protein